MIEVRDDLVCFEQIPDWKGFSVSKGFYDGKFLFLNRVGGEDNSDKVLAALVFDLELTI